MQTSDGVLGELNQQVISLSGLTVTDWLTLLLVASQLLFAALYLRRRTLAALSSQSERLQRDRNLLASVSAPVLVRRDQLTMEVHQALTASYPIDPARIQQPLSESFSAEHLLPIEYNARLDAATPGVFTAFGIIGTFVGLLVTFLTINFNDPSNSIQPLISGMRIAFVNSLVGVALALWWTVQSRNARHAHDILARSIADTVRERFGYVGGDQQVLKALTSISSAVEGQREVTQKGLETVKHAVDESAAGVQRNLAGTLEALVEKMVAMPFEALSGHIATFGELVQRSSEAHSQSHGVLVESVAALERARAVIESAVATSTQAVAQLEPLLEGFKGQAQATSELVGHAKEAVNEAGNTLITMRAEMERQQGLVDALTATTDALAGEATGLRSISGEFHGAADALTVAITKVQSDIPVAVAQAGTDLSVALATAMNALQTSLAAASAMAVDEQRKAVEQTVRVTEASLARLTDSLTSQLSASAAAFENASTGIATQLKRTGDEMIGAFGARTTELVDEMDRQFTELAQRVTADLGTHTNKLPEAAGEIVRAVSEVRRQLHESLKKLDATLHRVDTEQTEALKQRLKAFDELLAEAVNRMSGTIGTWDDHMGRLDQPFTAIATEVKALKEYREAADKTLERVLARASEGAVGGRDGTA